MSVYTTQCGSQMCVRVCVCQQSNSPKNYYYQKVKQRRREIEYEA